MGLDASVYKNKQHLPPDPDIQDVQRDALTGELYYSDETERKYSRDFFKATSKRLGNLASISALREEIERFMGTIPTILRSRVLYSALHAGDAIDVSDLDQLEAEIQMISLETGERASSLLKKFLQDMTELIRSARHEQNPIAF
jgi:hypothetical protein